MDGEPRTNGQGLANGEAPEGPDGRDVLIIIPAYNEEGRVGRVIAEVRRELPLADTLVINDGSTDGTAADAREAGAAVVSLPVNSGYGVALQTGYKFGVREGYETIGQIDADGQHRAEYLREMLATMEEQDADLIVGSRFLAEDDHYRTSRARSLGIGLFAGLSSLITHEQISDPTSGFQLMRSRVARLFCSEVYPTDYPDADVLILLHRTGYRVREIPVRMRASPGKSMHSAHSSPYYVYKMLLSIFVTLLRRGVKAVPRAELTP
ncbi:MAG TPA: glycosyltransferase family 2 protein [Solirubrobacteraceae bacterium]|nr:glycosyltransferase family 2 protein [Solirubrobacteraceae bacterium]